MHAAGVRMCEDVAARYRAADDHLAAISLAYLQRGMSTHTSEREHLHATRRCHQPAHPPCCNDRCD